MAKVIFTLRDGSVREVQGPHGLSLMLLAQQNGLDVEGACGGAMACSTCHMIVDPDWYGKLPPASDDELDMLDLAPGITKTSRLGCQIKLSDATDGLKVKLPKSTKSLL